MGRLELGLPEVSMDVDRGSTLDVSEDASEAAVVADSPIDVETSVVTVTGDVPEDTPENAVVPEAPMDVEMGSTPVVSENDLEATVVELEIPVDVEMGSVLAVAESVAKVVAVTLPKTPVDVKVGSVLAVSEDVPEALPKIPLDDEMGSVPVVSESVVKVMAVTLRVVVEVMVLLMTPLLTLVDALIRVYDVEVPTGVIVLRVVSPSREMTVVGRSTVVLEVGRVADPLSEVPEDVMSEPSLVVDVSCAPEEVKVVVSDTVPETVVVEVTCEPTEPDGVSVVLVETPAVEAGRDVGMPLAETDVAVEDVPIGSSLTETPVVDAGCDVRVPETVPVPLPVTVTVEPTRELKVPLKGSSIVTKVSVADVDEYVAVEEEATDVNESADVEEALDVKEALDVEEAANVNEAADVDVEVSDPDKGSAVLVSVPVVEELPGVEELGSPDESTGVTVTVPGEEPAEIYVEGWAVTVICDSVADSDPEDVPEISGEMLELDNPPVVVRDEEVARVDASTVAVLSLEADDGPELEARLPELARGSDVFVDSGVTVPLEAVAVTVMVPELEARLPELARRSDVFVDSVDAVPLEGLAVTVTIGSTVNVPDPDTIPELETTPDVFDGAKVAVPLEGLAVTVTVGSAENVPDSETRLPELEAAPDVFVDSVVTVPLEGLAVAVAVGSTEKVPEPDTRLPERETAPNVFVDSTEVALEGVAVTVTIGPAERVIEPESPEVETL